jgi:hypothetical protein
VHVCPLAIGAVAQPGYDPPVTADGAVTHGGGAQVNVAYVQAEAPAAVPVQVAVTELPTPPSLRCMPAAHWTVQVLPVLAAPQSLLVNGAVSAAHVAGSHVALPTKAPDWQAGSVPAWV